MADSRPVLSVVVPAYNEADNLLEAHERIAAALRRLGKPFEILFVDDGSTDGTPRRLGEIAARDPSVRALRFRKNNGKSAALAAGFQEAAGEIIVTIDADLQEDPAEIPALLAELDKGLDVAGGWRRDRADPSGKVAASRLFNALVRLLTGGPWRDVNCGFKAYRREVVKHLDLFGELHRVIPVLAAHQGFRVGEIPVRHAPRRRGATKFRGAGRGLHGILDLLAVQFLAHYQRRPLHFFGTAGLLLFAAGVAINLFLSIRYFLGIQFIGERLPLLMLGILLMIIGAQSFGMGLLGEMVLRGAPRRHKHEAYDRIA